MKLLEVDDVVYIVSHSEFIRVSIERVTKTKAIGKTKHGNSIRFQRQYTDYGFCTIAGRDTWDLRRAHIANDKYDALYVRQQLEARFSNLDPKTLSVEVLKSILSIANEGDTHD